MLMCLKKSTALCVALLAEGVDRNLVLSAAVIASKAVALLAEGVDRNQLSLRRLRQGDRRPPRGGRG